MNAYVRAFNAWLESTEFKGSSDPTSLKAPSDQRQYLENRLKRAFEAGWNARDASVKEKP